MHRDLGFRTIVTRFEHDSGGALTNGLNQADVTGINVERRVAGRLRDCRPRSAKRWRGLRRFNAKELHGKSIVCERWERKPTTRTFCVQRKRRTFEFKRDWRESPTNQRRFSDLREIDASLDYH
jgi:hypothetical protein